MEYYLFLLSYCIEGTGWGHFTNFLVEGVQHAVKNGPNQNKGFVKMERQNDLITLKKKEVNWIENQGKNLQY